MTSKWEPVRELLAHMYLDEDLMLQWGLIEHGDVRSAEGRRALVAMKQADLHQLAIALANRATGGKK